MEWTVETFQHYLAKWQDILRLRDWDIQIVPVETAWRKTGDIKIDTDDRKAAVLINMHNPRQTNAEHLLVHELLHLKLWAMDQMIETLIGHVYGTDESDPRRVIAYDQFMTTLESTVEDLAKGFIATAGEDTHISFGRLAAQIEAEIGPLPGKDE